MPKAVSDGASERYPAMAFSALSESVPSSVTMALRPCCIRRVWMCSPLPALPTVIFGAKVTSTPCCQASVRMIHLATTNWSAASSRLVGRNSISFCSYIRSPCVKLPTSECPYLIRPPASAMYFMASVRKAAPLLKGVDSW